MMNALFVAVSLCAGGQVSLDGIQTLGGQNPAAIAPSPVAASTSPFNSVASFDAGAVQPPPAPGAPGATSNTPQPGAAEAKPADGCPPAASSTSSVRPEWLAPGTCAGCWLDSDSCCARFIKAYYDAFNPSGDSPDSPPAARRALPEAWPSPPFPGHEFQGYPLVGVPPSNNSDYPLMKSLKGTGLGDWLTSNKIDVYGWATGSYNWSTSQKSNQPDSYWVVPNRAELDQVILRFERQADMVQTDHIDWGFRFTNMYGLDYRYLTAGGYFSQQLLLENLPNGYDPTEIYGEMYIPWVAQGMVIRVGRWIACPDIETQFAPDNYMGSHSLLFTYDTYTQSGVMLTFCLSEQWMFQCAITAGTDMAPWYPGATPTGFLGLRWVSKDNRDSIYTCLNNINTAKFRTFEEYGELVGHDNFNYIVSTWTHKFTQSGSIHTNTEAYYMWQFDAHVGGTSIAAPANELGGGGLGAPIPGVAAAYGVLNYTEFQLSKKAYMSVRNEVWEDQKGERTGFANLYSSHAVGISYNINELWQVRPEVGYYRGYYQRSFDDGNAMGEWIVGMDTTLRF
ncbi:MAG TPA: outer membrane beta-barrel protein [Planctomycetaceae bacterium]|nr:outer membrane beta-barrel protein [Planctomycetaceae bacterium]